MARRLEAARLEMEQAAWFDRVVVNDQVDRAAAELAAIINGTPDPRGGDAHAV
jgi:guanylate kinase